MKYHIRLGESGKCFITEISGKITPEDAKEYIIASRKFAIEHKVFNNLLDARKAINKASVLENYNFGYKDSVINVRNRILKLAVLISPEDTSHDFVLTVLNNAGFNMKVFHDYNQAITWLEKEDSE